MYVYISTCIYAIYVIGGNAKAVLALNLVFLIDGLLLAQKK